MARLNPNAVVLVLFGALAGFVAYGDGYHAAVGALIALAIVLIATFIE